MTRRGPPGHLTRPSRGAFFPAASGKLLLSLPAAQVPTRISPPRQQANAAEADTAAESADSNSLSRRAVDYPARPDSSPAPAADFVGAADSNTAPTVSKPALFRQRVPWTNFPAWPGQAIVQPMFVEKSALPISPPVGMAAAAPLSGPTVFSVKPWTVNRPDS
jgi:hypothetical protein